MPSKIETEFKKLTKLTQAAEEPRKAYLLRILGGGQQAKTEDWNKLSDDAQNWYNGAVNAYLTHNQLSDIPDFPDMPPPATERAKLTLAPAPAAEPDADEPPLDEGAPEAEGVDPDFEEDQPPEDGIGEIEEVEAPPAAVTPPPRAPRSAASKPTQPKPASKPTPKPPSSPKGKAAAAPAAAASNGGAPSKPPKAAPPGASTMIKRLLIKNPAVTNAELQERLKADGINVTSISVSTIRSDFRHSLKVLHEAGFAKEVNPL